MLCFCSPLGDDASQASASPLPPTAPKVFYPNRGHNPKGKDRPSILISAGRSFPTATCLPWAPAEVGIALPKADNSRPTAAQLFLKHGVGPSSGHQAAQELHGWGLGSASGRHAAQELHDSSRLQGSAGGSSQQLGSRPGSGGQGAAAGSKSNSVRKALGLRLPPPSVRQGAGPKAFGMVSRKPTALRQPVLQDPTKRRKPAGASPANPKGTPGAKRPRRQQSMEECLAGIGCSSEGEAEEDAAGCGKVFRDRGAGRDMAGNVGASPLLGSFYGAASRSS